MAPGQQTQKPPRTPGPEAGAGIFWAPKPKPADISAEGNLVCVCFPVVFLFQSWGAVCLLRVAI